jgi:hypothetical protein
LKQELKRGREKLARGAWVAVRRKQVKLVVKRIVTKQLHVLVVRKLYSVGDLKLCENDLKNVEIPK